MLKAYMAHEGSPAFDGCVLVFAHKRNQARYIGSCAIASWGCGEYEITHAIRKPAFDKYAKGDTPYVIESNNELPDGVAFFREIDIIY